MPNNNAAGNLKNIVECAREKQSEEHTNSRFTPSDMTHKFKSLFKSQNGTSHQSSRKKSKQNSAFQKQHISTVALPLFRKTFYYGLKNLTLLSIKPMV